MKIKLLKNHHHAGVMYLEGDTIEVDRPTYDFIMSVYMDDRKDLVLKEAEAKRIFDILSAPMEPDNG